MQKPIIQNDRDQRVYLYPEHPAPLPIPRASRALSAAFLYLRGLSAYCRVKQNRSPNGAGLRLSCGLLIFLILGCLPA